LFLNPEVITYCLLTLKENYNTRDFAKSRILYGIGEVVSVMNTSAKNYYDFLWGDVEDMIE